MRPATLPELGRPDFGLRPLLASDAPAWFGYLSQEVVFRHTSWNVTKVEDLTPLFMDYDSTAPTSTLRFAIVDLANGALAGSVGFHTVSVLNRSAEIAYDLAPQYWGQGLASEVCEQVCRWGFAQQDYLRIQATVLESNLGSQAVLRKCRFQLEGKLRSFRLVRGEPKDFLVYSRLAGE